MKKFTKIALIITAVFAVLGVALCIVGIGIGFRYSEFRGMVRDGIFGIGTNPWSWSDNWDDDRESDWDDEDNSGWYSGKAESFGFSSKESGEIKNLDMKMLCGEVIIKEAADEEIRVEVKYRKANHKRQIDVIQDGDTLKMVETGSSRLNNDAAMVTISIPSGMEFEEVNLDNSAGTITVSHEITAKNMNINVDAGECDTERKLTVSGTFFARVGAGEVNISEVEAAEMELKAGVGEIDVDRGTADDVILDCGIGSIGVDMTGRETDYSYTIDCGVGEVEIGENSYSGLGSKREVKNQGNKNMDINCGVGEISIEFDQ